MGTEMHRVDGGVKYLFMVRLSVRVCNGVFHMIVCVPRVLGRGVFDAHVPLCAWNSMLTKQQQYMCDRKLLDVNASAAEGTGPQFEVRTVFCRLALALHIAVATVLM